jgi:RNA polymerase sigma factor (sigma-70 family)
MLNKKYYPNYRRIYRGVKIKPKVLRVLRQTDRVMKRFEYDYKHGDPVYVNAFSGEPCGRSDPNAMISDYKPSREVSLEMLFDSFEKTVNEAMGIELEPSNECSCVLNEYANPLTFLLTKELFKELYRCISLLNSEERKLIYALFWEGLTETECAKLIGRTQSTVNDMKRRVLDKLRENFWN